MTNSPKKQDLSTLFPAPPAPEIPPDLAFLSRAVTRGLEISNLPQAIDPVRIIDNMCAAFEEVSPLKPLGYRQIVQGTNPPVESIKITFDQHVHYPTLMQVFTDVLEGELLRTNTFISPDSIPNVAALDVIMDPRTPPPPTDRYSGPRFMGH